MTLIGKPSLSSNCCDRVRPGTKRGSGTLYSYGDDIFAEREAEIMAKDPADVYGMDANYRPDLRDAWQLDEGTVR